MRRSTARTTRSKVAAVAAGAMAVTALLAVNTTPAGAGVQTPTGATEIAGASSAAGGFGLPKGSLPNAAPQSSMSVEDSTGDTGGCAGYATNVGAGIYCYGGETGGVPEDLIDRFPGLSFTPCRVYDIPTGMKAPRNQTPDKGRYYLQSCLEDVDLHDPYGGDPHVKLSFVYVDYDEPDPTEWDPNPLEEFLWAQVRSNYPVPFVTAWPTHIPRVGTPTWFQFRWLDEDMNAATQGPYTGNEDGGPYLELNYGDVSLKAEADSVEIVPRIEGMQPAQCGEVPKPYDQDAEPTLEAQDNPCYLVFEHSSAAAEQLTTIELPERNDDYPVPMYVIEVHVTWHVWMEGGVGDDLGTHEFVAYQELPVSEVTGLVGQEL